MSKLNFADSSEPNGAAALDGSKLAGLCLTCNFAQDCVRAKHHGQAVWYCEEFDDYTPPAAGSTGTGWKVLEESNSPKAKEDTRTFGGVCINCATRETCTFSKAGADIWECNEYS